MPAKTRLTGPFSPQERNILIQAVYQELHRRQIPVSKRALNSLLSWNWTTLYSFTRDARIDAAKFIQIIDDAVSAIHAYPRRALPELQGETSGDRLRAARRHRQRTQHDVARIAGIGAENLSRYERDARSLRNAELRTLIGIAMTLECPLIDVYRRILQIAA